MRSSWLASATKPRSRSSAPCRRPEHRVQRLAEPADLVPRLRERQPPPGLASRDGGSLRAHRLDGPKRGGREGVAEQRGREQGGRADQEQLGEEPAQRLVAVLERGADDDDHLALRALHGPLERPGGAVEASWSRLENPAVGREDLDEALVRRDRRVPDRLASSHLGRRPGPTAPRAPRRSPRRATTASRK